MVINAPYLPVSAAAGPAQPVVPLQKEKLKSLPFVSVPMDRIEAIEDLVDESGAVVAGWCRVVLVSRSYFVPVSRVAFLGQVAALQEQAAARQAVQLPRGLVLPS